jgi:hypothetical protein
VEEAIRQLKRGVMSRRRSTEAKAFSRLYRAGAKAVPYLKREFERIDLTVSKFPEIGALAACLASLLNDISEEDSIRLIEQALAKPHHPAIGSALRSVLRFNRANFRETMFGESVILEEKIIDERYSATHHVTRWLGNVPSADLTGISRIYIISDQPDIDFRGHYQQHIAVVTLVWDTRSHPLSPANLLRRLLNENTLYHEVGHHCLGHTEPGQEPGQEEEAKRYAAILTVEARPVFATVLKAFMILTRRKKKEDEEHIG